MPDHATHGLKYFDAPGNQLKKVSAKNCNAPCLDFVARQCLPTAPMNGGRYSGKAAIFNFYHGSPTGFTTRRLRALTSSSEYEKVQDVFAKSTFSGGDMSDDQFG
jgi:hypothetical protein